MRILGKMTPLRVRWLACNNVFFDAFSLGLVDAQSHGDQTHLV